METTDIQTTLLSKTNVCSSSKGDCYRWFPWELGGHRWFQNKHLEDNEMKHWAERLVRRYERNTEDLMFCHLDYKHQDAFVWTPSKSPSLSELKAAHSVPCLFIPQKLPRWQTWSYFHQMDSDKPSSGSYIPNHTYICFQIICEVWKLPWWRQQSRGWEFDLSVEVNHGVQGSVGRVVTWWHRGCARANRLCLSCVH
jgi:hypothetical protein